MIEQQDKLNAYTDKHYESLIIEPLVEFVKIPNLSRLYDEPQANIQKNTTALKFCMDFAKSQQIEGLKMEMITSEGKTP